MVSNFWTWYLGERVLDWQKGPDRRRILKSPPRSIFWTHQLTERELERIMAGIRAANIQVRTKVRYKEFIRSSLLGGLPLSASSTARVSILAF